MPTVADQIVEIPKGAGVHRVRGGGGGSFNCFTGSILRYGRIDWLYVRHDGAAAFAGTGEAAATRGLTVCAEGCGPGNLRLIHFNAARINVEVRLALASSRLAASSRPQRRLPVWPSATRPQLERRPGCARQEIRGGF
jgi:pyruvate dehydrogenase (quinone)